eukprot:2270435-Amphidinium_carterae.1
MLYKIGLESSTLQLPGKLAPESLQHWYRSILCPMSKGAKQQQPPFGEETWEPTCSVTGSASAPQCMQLSNASLSQ